MNKLKFTFSSLNRQNSSDKHRSSTEKGRPEVFIKRLSSSALPKQEEEEVTPKVKLEDLSEIELKAYQAWWKDLDPFHIGKADNATVFKFVSGCQLPDSVLEEILSLFENQKDALDQEQFFAILRLIAHAQNGRTVNRDIVYLGAPLPRFQTQAIDALINKPAVEENASRASFDNTRTSFEANNRASFDNIDARTSFENHARTSFDTIASSYNSGNSSVSYHSAIPQHSNSMPSWMIQPTLPPAAVLPLPSTTITNEITTVTPPMIYTPIQHSRSRSVPYANTNFLFSPQSIAIENVSNSSSPTTSSPKNNLYQFDTVGASTSKQQQKTPLRQHSSHVSLDNDALQKIINNNGDGGGLLLTQSFKPQFDADSTTNSPNISSSQSSPKKSNNPYKNNPFETDDSTGSTPRQLSPLIKSSPLTRSCNNNTSSNTNQIPPPPVPPQSTKPPCPKYARRISIK